MVAKAPVACCICVPVVISAADGFGYGLENVGQVCDGVLTGRCVSALSRCLFTISYQLFTIPRCFCDYAGIAEVLHRCPVSDGLPVFSL